MSAELQSTPEIADTRETRLGQLIVSIFGLYAREEGNSLSVASVVALMADLGAPDQAVRSSVSRLKRRGVLRSERVRGAAGYALTEPALDVLAEGDVRIFERVRATEDDGWLVVVFSVPESERDKRHALRSSLSRLGFGTVAPGVWLAPGNLEGEALHTLERRGLSGYVDIFTGRHFAFGELRSKIPKWWDLAELSELYGDFLRRYRPLLDRVREGSTTPLEAFQMYLPMLTQWRRLPYRDPGLPLSLLPANWDGEAAGTLFDDLNKALNGPAHDHARAVIHPRP
jgi:phenylacetic acid degradation operon negative regulatory protein